MLLSAVSVLVVAQASSEIPEGLMNNPVFTQQNDFLIAGQLWFSGTFEYSPKAPNNFVMSVCLPVCSHGSAYLPPGGIFCKCDIGGFIKIMWRKV